jgi:hypothetical protein
MCYLQVSLYTDDDDCFLCLVFSGEEDDDVEVKQTYISQYSNMHD